LDDKSQAKAEAQTQAEAQAQAKAGSQAQAKAKSHSQASFEKQKRLVSTPFYRAYLKVADGCDHRCSFCVIPKLRGPFRARGIRELSAEAKELAEAGVVELTLVAQDLFSYRDGKKDLRDLCHSLSKIPSLRWIRLMYAHPDMIDLKLIKDLREIKSVVPYLDVPFQHASPKFLSLMGRKPKDPLILVNKLREIWPEAALRATLMTGFPGEGEEEFKLLLTFLREARFQNAGFFKFSPEEGSKAFSLPERPTRLVADKRFRKLSSEQRKISKENLSGLVGKELEVLSELPSEDFPLANRGRAYFQAPMIDGSVYFEGQAPKAGEIVKAKALRAGHYDLIVSLSEEKSLSWKRTS
jgi:MiaB/RimO family radical SAM methylthiotransferase